jgi:hypothetical protein
MLSNDYGMFPLLNDSISPINVYDVVKALRQSIFNTPITIGGIQVTLTRSVTGNGGYRYWFTCPSCGSRVAKLYPQTPLLACRHCLHIKYRSSRYKGMIESDVMHETGAW